MNFEVDTVLGEYPMAKPANHDPSANMVLSPDVESDPDPDIESDPEYVEPEYTNPGSVPDPGIVVPC